MIYIGTQYIFYKSKLFLVYSNVSFSADIKVDFTKWLLERIWLNRKGTEPNWKERVESGPQRNRLLIERTSWFVISTAWWKPDFIDFSNPNIPKETRKQVLWRTVKVMYINLQIRRLRENRIVIFRYVEQCHIEKEVDLYSVAQKVRDWTYWLKWW